MKETTSFPGSLSPRSWGRGERDPGNEVDERDRNARRLARLGV